MKDPADRIRSRTAVETLQQIDDATFANVSQYANLSDADIDHRLQELDAEWDTDRMVETEAAITALIGLALGMLVRKRFLLIPGIVAGSVLFQAVTGRYPLMPLFRRLGLRSAREIQRERYALKALRGDFQGMSTTPAETVPRHLH